MFNAPRKRFGQNFLQDNNVIDKIIHAIRPARDDVLVEIGPGRGALTLPLLTHVDNLHIIELDRDLVAWWQQQPYPNLRVHAVDALKFDFASLPLANDQRLRIIGNLPYNISTPLLFHLFDFADRIEDLHLMLQKEVVDRINATPGNKTYGRLSVMSQFYSETQKLFEVHPGSFQPPPKVESAVIRLRPHHGPHPCDPATLRQVVQQAFSQRRKTLRNSLKHLLSAEQLTALGIDPSARPETLPLADFVRLAQAVTSTQPGY